MSVKALRQSSFTKYLNIIFCFTALTMRTWIELSDHEKFNVVGNKIHRLNLDTIKIYCNKSNKNVVIDDFHSNLMFNCRFLVIE